MTFRKSDSGFSIVELLIAIAMIGVIAGSATSFLVGINNIQQKISYKENALRAATTEMESLRNAKYNTLENGVNIDFTADLPENLPNDKQGIVYISEPVTGLKKVIVEVTYTESSKQQKVKLVTMIGQIGLSK